MNISPLAKQFIPILQKNKTKKREDINYDLIMLSLYKDLLEADKYVNNRAYTFFSLVEPVVLTVFVFKLFL